MNRMGLPCYGLALTLTLTLIGFSFAGEPLDQLRQTSDKVLTILSESALKPPEKARERRELILRAVEERFDWEEMARRCLGRHWAQRTPEERQEFVHLFKELIERVYMDKVEGYSWNKILYERERIDGDFAAIMVKVFTSKDQTIQIEYRMRKKGTRWLIYDFSVEGVGLVNNYRTQFNEIILKSSYEEFVRRLKAKSFQN